MRCGIQLQTDSDPYPVLPFTGWWLWAACLPSRSLPSCAKYEVAAFALGPSAHQILRAPCKSDVPVSPSPVEMLQLSLQSQMLWELLFPKTDPQAGEPDMGLRTLTPVGEPLQYNYSPVWGSPTPSQVYGIWLYCECAPLTVSLWFLLYVFGYRISFLVGSYLFFIDGCSAVSCDFGVLTRGGELQVLLLRHLVPGTEEILIQGHCALQEIDHVPTVSIREKSPYASSRREKEPLLRSAC